MALRAAEQEERVRLTQHVERVQVIEPGRLFAHEMLDAEIARMRNDARVAADRLIACPEEVETNPVRQLRITLDQRPCTGEHCTQRCDAERQQRARVANVDAAIGGNQSAMRAAPLERLDVRRVPADWNLRDLAWGNSCSPTQR